MKRLFSLVALFFVFGSSNGQSTSFYDFNTAGDLSLYFNQGGSAANITESTSGGIGGSRSVQVTSSRTNEVFTTKDGYALGAVGSTYEFSSFVKSVYNSGYSGLGFTDASPSTYSSYAKPSTTLGISVHGGGFIFHNNSTDYSGNWSSGGSNITSIKNATISDLLNNGSADDWYKVILKIEKTSIDKFKMRVEIWSSDSNGNLLRPSEADAIMEISDLVNSDISTAPIIYSYFAFGGSRVSDFDNYGMVLNGSSIVQQGKPAILTVDATHISGTIAVDIDVTSGGGESISDAGFVYSTSENPTIADEKISLGSDVGEFSGATSQLSPGTYFVRAYATNSNGTSYGEQKEVEVPVTAGSGNLFVVESGGDESGTTWQIVSSKLITSGDDNASVNASVVETALASGDLTLNTNGYISIDTNIDWTTDSSLTIQSAGNIFLNSVITANNDDAGIKIYHGGSNSSTAANSEYDYIFNLANDARIQMTGSNASVHIANEAYSVINSTADLANISTNSSARVVLTGDIDLSATTYTDAVITTAFEGVFEGFGNEFQNLKIRNSGGSQINLGFFSEARGATIRDLGVTEMDIFTSSTSNSTEYRIGGIVGNIGQASLSSGYSKTAYTTTLNGVWTSGKIATANTDPVTTASDTDKQKIFFAGGLVGNINNGTAVITRSYSTADVSSAGSEISGRLSVGGLIGDAGNYDKTRNSTTAKLVLDRSYSTGSILTAHHSSSYYGTGGLVGVVYVTDSSISNCYSWSNVVSQDVSYGGIAGFQLTGASSVNSYTTLSKKGNGSFPSNVYASVTAISPSSGTNLPTGFSDTYWTKEDGKLPRLKELTYPRTALYVKVNNGKGPVGNIFPTYTIVNESGNAVDLATLGLTTPTGTALYTIDNSTPAGTYSDVAYLGGLTLNGVNKASYILRPYSTFAIYEISATAPNITSFAPTSVALGGTVVITGSNLTNVDEVLVGDVAATFTVDSATQITFTIPSGSVSGSVTVSTPNDGQSSKDGLTILGLNTTSSAVTFLENTINESAATLLGNLDVSYGSTLNSFNGKVWSLSYLNSTGGTEDVLSILEEGTGTGQINLQLGYTNNTNAVRSGTTVIGTFRSSLDGSGVNGERLIITWNSSATKEDLDRVIQLLSYKNTSNTPAASRQIRISIQDTSTINRDITVNVTAENDAPTLGSSSTEIADITTPGDPINFYPTSGSSSPGSEQVPNAIDNNSQTKYLNFYKAGSGFTVTPQSGPTKVNQLTFSTANDSSERDPMTYTLLGSNDDGDSFEVIIANDPTGVTTTRFDKVSADEFTNEKSFSTYRLIFPTLRGSANSMQIGEVELLGVPFQRVVFAIGADPAPVYSTLPLFDAEDDNLTSAEVKIASGFDSTDVLSWTDISGVTGSYNSSTGVLSFTGNASAQNYRTLLRSVKFTSSGNANGKERQVTFKATDENGDESSATTSKVIVTFAPTLTSIDPIGVFDRSQSNQITHTLLTSKSIGLGDNDTEDSPLSFIIESIGSNGTLKDSNDKVLSVGQVISANESIYWTPTSDGEDVVIMTVKAYDGDLASPTAVEVKGTVVGVNSPRITSFTPTSASAGDTITITGSNFSNVTDVSFGGTSATIVSKTATEIVVTLGAGSTGNVEVSGTDGSFSKSGFTYIPGDTDGDGVLDVDDNCPNTPNADQADADGDGIGDVCDYDKDDDGYLENYTATIGTEALSLKGSDKILFTTKQVPFSNDKMTIEFFAKTSNTSVNYDQAKFLGWSKSGGNDNVQLRLYNGQVQFGMHDYTNDTGGWTTAKSTSTVNDGEFHHIALTKDGSTVKIYIDGVLEDTQTLARTMTVNTFTIGENNAFEFVLDEFRIWSDVRSFQEIRNFMFAKLNGNENDLLLYYDFEEGSPGANNSSITQLTDSSGNGYVGLLNGFDMSGIASNFIEVSHTVLYNDNCVSITNPDQLDTDNDGEGDVCDTDDDGDGTSDSEDAFPLDPDEDTDTDGDGTGDNADTDDDGDGTSDSEDAFPLDPDEDTDTDGDGTGDNADTDDDGDGTSDSEDAFPLDPDEDTDTDGDGTGDNADTDDDGDGTSDSEDAFPLDPDEDTDTDGDGTGDNADTDDDGDGTSDSEDAFPLDPDEDTDTDGDGTGDNADTDDDGDGTSDSEDAFPLDPDEDTDTDGDGTGDNADTDDDGDGTSDSEDAFPLDPDEDTDTDGDGTGDNADTDDDGDGVSDSEDNCPAIANPDQLDTDNDGQGNICDTDDDGDGTPDTDDAFPLDSTEDTDTDGDGTGDNADTDDDGDGTPDTDDAFPLDSTEDNDADGDGTGDNADTDDDNDGISDETDPDDDNDGTPDTDDAFPLDSTEDTDTDGDGTGNNADTDDDGDGTPDTEDAFPLDSEEAFDADGDGIGDNADPDDDNDGVEDSYDACPNTAPGTAVDINGCDLLIIPAEDFTVAATSATCSNTNDGEILIEALDQTHEYQVTVTGQSTQLALNATSGYAKTITGLSKGTYQVCFTVVGDSIFKQCFTVYIDQPEALQVVSSYLEAKQALDLQIDGATEYYVELNGVLQTRRGSRISLALSKGMNRVKIYTDLDCQGVIEEEVFVSEKLEYAPNPVQDKLNLYVGGTDSEVKLTITDLNGVLIETREIRVPASRIYTMNMSRYTEGVYILTAEGVTVRKTIKVVKR